MNNRILIPFDFTPGSLATLKVVLSEMEALKQKCSVVLLYAEFLNDSITDLLFYRPHKRIDQLSTQQFQESLSIIRNRFESGIESIRIELFHGRNVAAMRNFLEAHEIEKVFIPADYELKTPANAFDPAHLIRKSGIAFSEVTTNSTH